MTPLDLMEILPRGRDRATSIPFLAARLGASEREVRDMIQTLVTELHAPIVTLPASNGRSVFLAANVAEIEMAIANINSRAMALLRRKRGLRIARESLAWSPTLFGEGR